MRNKLKNLRKENGDTQKSFAKKIDITLKAYQMIEQGRRFPCEHTLRKIMKELETNDISLFDDTPNSVNKNV